MVSLAIAVDGLGVLSAGDGLAEAVFDQGAGAVRVAGLVQGGQFKESCCFGTDFETGYQNKKKYYDKTESSVAMTYNNDVILSNDENLKTTLNLRSAAIIYTSSLFWKLF